MFSPSKYYLLCFEHLDSLRKNKRYLNLNSPLDLPSLIARNYIKKEYYSLRLSKTCVIVNAISHVECFPRPLPTIYLFGPDLISEKEAVLRSGYFLEFPQDWSEVNGYGWSGEHLGLNVAKKSELLRQFEEHEWLHEAVAKIDQLTTEEIIRLAYDFAFQRPKPNGSKRTLGLEAFSETATNTIIRNFMRARANQLVRDGLECTANDIVTITELENDLNQNGFSNEECLKIGPSNNLLTFQAIHFLNSSGWKANVRTLAYLLSCKYLRLETRLREHKKALKLSAPSRKKVLDEKIEYELEEKQKVEKSSLKFVRNSVESLIKQDAIVDLGDYYLALGNELETSFGKITIDPYNGLYSSVLQKISDIHHLTLHGSPPNQPILLSRKPTLYKPRVHIASTCHDFRDLRREVAQSLREWGYQPYLNEDSDYPVKVGVSSYQACIDAVKQSDCLVLIIGTRYGGMVEDKGISITELEYRTACEVGIPRINFCLNEVWNLVPVVRKNPGMTYPEYFHEGKEKADKIFKFLDYVRKYEKEKTDNWVHPFRDSVGLKEILQKRLEPVFPTKL